VIGIGYVYSLNFLLCQLTSYVIDWDMFIVFWCLECW